MLNSDLKLIEKVLAERIKPNLFRIIHSDQRGFLKGRRSCVNMRCILDLMSYVEDTDQEGWVMSVDYEKCFDKIERQSLIGAMKVFNFGTNMMQWVEILYKHSTLKVVNNGHLTSKIVQTRGCKQGAPCSPYFFLICAELLAHQLRDNKNIQGFEINNFKKLFGQYADDMDLYFKNTKRNFKEIKATLSAFCQATGLKINYDKTSLYRIGKHNAAMATEYTKEMKIEKEKINVLGIWITRDRGTLFHENYDGILDKTKAVLNSWSNRRLSLIGKITVVNALVSSLYVYKMQVLPCLPEYMYKKIDKIIEGFLWNGR